MKTSLRLVPLFFGFAFLAGGCGSASSMATPTTEQTTTTAATTTSAAGPVSITTYCATVKAATALRPDGKTIDVTTEGKYATYADALDKVVAASPAAEKAFWQATDNLARTIAGGGAGDRAADGQVALQGLPAAGAEVKTDCKINLND